MTGWVHDTHSSRNKMPVLVAVTTNLKYDDARCVVLPTTMVTPTTSRLTEYFHTPRITCTSAGRMLVHWPQQVTTTNGCEGEVLHRVRRVGQPAPSCQ